MLANDSNAGRRQSEFFLVIRPHNAVAELMAECPSCGATTSLALELAWRLDAVSCSECHRAMRLDEDVVQGFRERLKDTMMRMNALLRHPSSD
jgi:Zn ribbon nucleic-acid-binding protein